MRDSNIQLKCCNNALKKSSHNNYTEPSKLKKTNIGDKHRHKRKKIRFKRLKRRPTWYNPRSQYKDIFGRKTEDTNFKSTHMD